MWFTRGLTLGVLLLFLFQAGCGGSGSGNPNQPPSASDESVSLLAGQSADVNVLSNDSDANGGSLAILRISQPSNGSVLILPPDTLRYTPKPGYIGADKLQYWVGDGQGGESSAWLYLDVTSISASPVVSLTTSTLQYLEDDLAFLFDSAATLTDPDTVSFPGGVLTVTILVGGDPQDRLEIRNQGVGAGEIGLSGSQVTYQGVVIGSFSGGSDGSTPLVVNTVAAADLVAIQALLRNVIFRSLSQNPGGPTRTIQVTFADGTQAVSPPVSRDLDLIPINDAPSFSVGATPNTSEDSGAVTLSGWATSISPGAPEEAAQVLTFNITGNTNPGLFAIAPALASDGTLSYTPVADANGSTVLDVTLSDDGGVLNGGVDTSPIQTFAIHILPVNDPPSFVKGADQQIFRGSGLQTVAGWASALSVGPANETTQTLSFHFTGNTNPGVFSAGPAIAANGDLTYTPSVTTSGIATLTVSVSDNGGVLNGGNDTSAAQTFSISVLETFRKARGVDGSVFAIAPAIDGSDHIFLSGAFTTYDTEASNRLLRIQGDGVSDPTFSIGAGFNNTPRTIVPATDGSGDLYVGGQFVLYQGAAAPFLIRLDSDGTRDLGFAVGGGCNDYVHSLSVADDGSGDIYVGGKFSSYAGSPSTRLVRINSDGSRDAGFAVGTGFDLSVNAVAVARDGSGDVYVGGDFTTYNGTGVNHLVRLNTDVSVDGGFALGTGFDATVKTLAVATDGSGDLYVGGNFTSYNGTGVNRLVRLNSDGSVDPGLGVGSGFDAAVSTLEIASDGSGDVYVGGAFTTYSGAAAGRALRLDSDGSVDPGFALGSGFDDEVLDIAATSDGSGDIVIGGSFRAYSGQGANRVVRLNSDGTPDLALETGSGFSALPAAVEAATDASGDLYVGGSFTLYNGQSVNRLVRLESGGLQDPGFASGTGFDNLVYTLGLTNDGSGDLYVGGLFSSYNGTPANRLIRLNSNGTVDPGFSTGVGFNGWIQRAVPAVDGTGDLYVTGGYTSYQGVLVSNLMRLNSNGTVDAGFAVGTAANSSIFAIVPATDGSGDVYVGGAFTFFNGTPANRVIRLNGDGSYDPGFAMGSGFNGNVLSILPATDGSGDLYLGGNFTTYQAIAANRAIRLNSDGTRDASFDAGVGFNGAVNRLAFASDASGDLWAGGSFTTYRGGGGPFLARLDSDGTPDAGFSSGAGPAGGSVEWITSTLDSSGDVVATGLFLTYDGAVVDQIVRIASNGTAR